MKATGIVVEYNPFHNGHHLHANAAKETTNADVVIAVMSGNFLQRGEPAIVDKWFRTEMALKNGVDIVFELPYVFATAHAQNFAEGAIKLLDAALCEHYCYGSEDGQTTSFQQALQLIRQNHDSYEQSIRQAVEQGMSYPKALNEAYQSIQQFRDATTVVDLTKPNNILGFHYMLAAEKIQSKMSAATITRVGAQYHDQEFSNQSIGSATAIRQSFFQSSSLDSVQNFMPASVYDLLLQAQAEHIPFANWEMLYPYLRFTILREGPENLQKIADIVEGIENLMYRAALQAENFSQFMTLIKSKRYTWTRLQRMLTHILTGVQQTTRDTIQEPSYLRLLGMTENGRNYLNTYKKAFKLPLLTKVGNANDPSLTLDIHTANMYYQSTGQFQAVNRDYKQSPIYMRL